MVKSVFVGILVSGTAASASEWPQWRGPNRDAASEAHEAPHPWPAELTRKWRSPAGAGQSSPVVSGGVVFLFSREEELEVARALELRTGRTLWRQGYRAPYRVYPGAASYGSGPKSTPVVHQGRLFTLGISGILTAFDAKDGRVVWQKDFTGRFKATSPPSAPRCPP